MAAIKFSWIENLGAMIDNDAQIRVDCSACGGGRKFKKADLIALAEKVGRDYDLYNRRCPCRFSKKCRGWNSFSFLCGVMRPLRDPETGMKWACGPRYSRPDKDGNYDF